MKFLQDWSPLRTRYCSIEPFTMMALGTGLQAGGSIFSGIMGKSAAKKQAEAIRSAQQKAEKYNDLASGELRSFRERGDTAGGLLADLLTGKVDADSVIKASSLFQFQEREGSTAINRELKARGLYGSGAGLESLRKFENQLVGEEGQRHYDRLFQLSEQGRVAATTIAGNDIATGNMVANLEAQRGGALAAGDQAIGQGISGALNAVAGGGMQYMNYKMIEPLLAKLGGGKGSDYTEEQALAIQQESLGRGLAFGAQNQWYQDQKDHAGMLADGVSWTSSGF
jgi:hypothetical protein